MADAPANPPAKKPEDRTRTVSYTATAKAQDNSKDLTYPSAANMAAVDEVDDFLHERLRVPVAMSVADGQIQLTFDKAARKEYSPPNPEQVFFMAITPADKAKVKDNPIVMSLDGSDFDLKPIDRSTKSASGEVGIRKAADIAGDILQQLKDGLRGDEDKRVYSLPEGGFVFAGPSARLLADELAEQKILFWNLSTVPNAVDILIGIRELPAPKKDAAKPDVKQGDAGAVAAKKA